MRRSPRPRARRAFTLVELLVVIGIIALLISVLLPSLNKARQAANLVDCQARLQQMGQALHLYVQQNGGLLPWGVLNHAAPWTDTTLPNASNQEQLWWWFFTLSETVGQNVLDSDGFARHISPIFRDRDTIEPIGDVPFVIHYTCNPRLLYGTHIPDTAPAIFSGQLEIRDADLTQRRITSVRRPSDVFVIWDAPQAMQLNANAYGIAEALDAWGWYNTSGLCYDTPATSFMVARPVLPGQLGVSGRQSGKVFQKSYNFDPKNAFNPNGWLSHLRFRHMNNTRLAALCLDGHVVTRGVGEVMVRDVFTNYR